MTSAEIRQRFLNFFKERDHKVLPSSSLIPFGDPTLLLTSAGMVPFKPYFLGQADPPWPRAATSQKVFRTVDVELVGHDGHHLTFFEMLGNFSFGGYFKEKAIPYAYELLTQEFRLDPERLWAGIHNDDDESYQIWTTKTAIPPQRIRRFGDDYNFWAAGPIADPTVSTVTAFSRSGTWSSCNGIATRRELARRCSARGSTPGWGWSASLPW